MSQFMANGHRPPISKTITLIAALVAVAWLSTTASAQFGEEKIQELLPFDQLLEPERTLPETFYNPIVTPAPTPEIWVPRGDLTLSTDEGTSFGAYLAAHPEPRAAVLLVPEWWGLNQAARDEALYWGTRETRALAVDLYDGELPESSLAANRMSRALDPAQVQARLRAGVRELLHGDGAKGELPLLVIGYGVGADHARRLASDEVTPVDAVVLYYGGVLPPPTSEDSPLAPVLAFFADRDTWITPRRIEEFRAGLELAGTPHQFFTMFAHSGFALGGRELRNSSALGGSRQEIELVIERLAEGNPAIGTMEPTGSESVEDPLSPLLGLDDAE